MKYLITILLSVSFLNVQCQDDTLKVMGEARVSPYHFDSWSRENDTYLLLGGSSMMVIGHYLNDTKDPLTEEEVLAADKNDIPGFERNVINNYDPNAPETSDLLLLSGFASSAVITALLPGRGRDRVNNLFLLTETIVLTNSFNLFAKIVTQRKRPFVYNDEVSINKKTNKNAIESFYSGHAANAAALSFFSAKVLQDYYPGSVVSTVAWPLAFILPGSVAYLRVTGGRHFPSDVITGYIIGAAVGFGVPWAHHDNRYKDREGGQSFHFNIGPATDIPNGVAIHITF